MELLMVRVFARFKWHVVYWHTRNSGKRLFEENFKVRRFDQQYFSSWWTHNSNQYCKNLIYRIPLLGMWYRNVKRTSWVKLFTLKIQIDVVPWDSFEKENGPVQLTQPNPEKANADRDTHSQGSTHQKPTNASLHKIGELLFPIFQGWEEISFWKESGRR